MNFNFNDMSGVIIFLIKALLWLGLCHYAGMLVRNTSEDGFISASITSSPAVLLPLQKFTRFILSIPSRLIEVLIKILLSILQIPLTLAWKAIPGLDTISPEPKIASLLG